MSLRRVKNTQVAFVFNNADAIAMLTTMSGFDRCVSIIATTNSQEYLKDIQTFLLSVNLKKPETASKETPAINEDKNSVLGTWKANASDNSAYRMNNGIMNYIMRQYSFNADGTYTFTSKAFDPLMDKILLGKESGTYKITGSSLVVSPEKSVLEAWSKKDGADKWGKLLSTQNIAPEKTTYQFTKYYFSGIQQWSLVLQANTATIRDGPFSKNDVFKNAWYYGALSTNNNVIELPAGQQTAATGLKKDPISQPNNTGFTFTTSNFDDGWVSNVKEDWVEVTKGNVKVLIHYPNKAADAYNSVLMDGLKNAWNILVAPKYSSASNMQFKPVGGWESVEFGEADMIEKAGGKSVHVVFFKKNFSGGGGKYLEFITPNKNSFEQEFGTYQNAVGDGFGTGSGFTRMANMASYNKFAVAASDLKGKWTNNFTGLQQYVNAYTGASAGADTHASNESFEFFAGNTYQWSLGVASGFVGNIKFQSAKAAGKFSLPTNWKVNFSDIEGKPKTYDAFFSCIKGARVLWLGDTAFGKNE